MLDSPVDIECIRRGTGGEDTTGIHRRLHPDGQDHQVMGLRRLLCGIAT